MPLTSKQKAALEAKAKEKGIEPAKLIAAAEALSSEGATTDAPKAPGAAAKGEKPNLYMYHLPFVTVNEVRTIWLDLEPVAGGEEYAGIWAAKQGAPTKEPTE